MDGSRVHTPRLIARITDPPPIAQMVIGMPAMDAAAVLPRVFNLCRGAQELAARMAFGLQVRDGAEVALAGEILRDHVLKLCFKVPGLLGLPPIDLPREWQTNTGGLRVCLFGRAGALPETLAELDLFLKGRAGIAVVLAAIQKLYDPGEAGAPDLPFTMPHTALARTAQENSVAGRHAWRPLMQEIAGVYGRGPFWRAVGLVLDMECCLSRALPNPVALSDGRVVVPAARGYYALWVRVENGRVAAIRRTTPTDHLCAEGGVLQHVVSRLDRAADDPATAVLLDLLDPCTPATLTETAHA